MTRTKPQLQITLDRKGDATIGSQLYQALRQAVLSGTLKPGQTVPSTRQLSADLGIARSTVIECYQQLIQEGYLETRAAAATTVSEKLPDVGADAHDGSKQAEEVHYAELSEYGKRLAGTNLSELWAEEAEICFWPWRTAYDHLPLEEWSRSVWHQMRSASPALLDYARERIGAPELREAIAVMVTRIRGIACSSEQVIVTLGWQQSLDILCRVFVNPGDCVAMEDPSWMKDRRALELNGARVLPIPVDQDGLNVDELMSRPEKIKLVYVTPSHQFPTGSVLSLARRLQLLRWARENGVLIIEDDYDSDIRFYGQPIPALKALDEHDMVLYIETFTKVLYASVGVGYLIVPKTFARVCANARRLTCDPVPLQLQMAVAEFINEGHLQRHRKRMRTLYEERREALVSAIARNFGKRASVCGDAAGLHVMVQIETGVSESEFVEMAAKAGVGIMGTAEFYADGQPRGEYVIGYGNLEPEQIREGIKRLAKIAKNGA